MRAFNMKWVYRILAGGLILSGLLFYFSLPAAVSETSVAGGGFIRLHVLANSDSEADQALKRKVRDEIIQVMAPEFLASGDIESARLTARSNLDRIELIASRVIKAEGKDYPVTAELNTFPFPTKHYGAFILPAGDYEAVRVVIGNGEGTNWWCVLFPPLCFVDMTRNAAIDTPAMSFPSVPSKPDIPVSKQTSQTLDVQIAGDTNGKPEAYIPDEQKMENYNTQAAGDVNFRAGDEEDDCKVIFSFRLIEWLKRL
ncbi:Stage II sporulation protein R [Pelotomaculum sp. FP]|uniref:stage II sporulation protein R n=1 Tax=Pelotomaculum sp. FP TaxID=261474 RepID=UPI001103E9F4|nr:stage II sporulation protein R [Pelotomaculum sp. FP]TEB17218.1 Stage II sporulation protein R [Pelotomaculum sp. FP]